MKQGFDVRVVSYEQVHNIQENDWNAFMDAVNPQPGEVILDGMCGYGACAKGITKRTQEAQLYFLDESEVQIKRARENFPNLPEDRFKTEAMEFSSFEDGFFDKVVIKMGLHEVPLEDQPKISNEVYRILKPGGKLILWDIMLNDDTQLLFQDIIRKKDELAGFEMLVKERYFFKEEQFLNHMKKANFGKVENYHEMIYEFSSINRLHAEFKSDEKTLAQFNEYIIERFPNELKQKLNYKEFPNDLQFNVLKKVYLMTK